MRTTLDLRLADPTGLAPGLLAELRDERRALLFDIGERGALAARTLLRVSHLFVSHAHMDHFSGLDSLLALRLGRVPRLELWGGPGFCDRVEHKLRAYTWNVVQRYAVPMVIEAHAYSPGAPREHARFASLRGFEREPLPAQALDCDVLLDEPLLRVRAAVVDHEMPVLAFAIEEQAQWRVRAERIAAMGLATGAWLRTLKAAVHAGAGDDTPIALQWRDRAGEHRAERRLGELRALLLDRVPGRRIGYVTDLRFTEANIEALAGLLAGADLLFIEAAFMEAERAHALRKNHLTARQAGEIARRLGARHVVPFHHSPRYRGREAELMAELRAAWQPPNAMPV